MQALLVNQSPVSSITYSNKMRVIYDGVEQDAELRKYPSGKIYFRTENAHFVPVNEVGVLIPLTKGKSAIVDFEDYEYLRLWKWRSHGKGYASRANNFKDENEIWRSRSLLMHRVIMKASGNAFVDHIDNDTLNNRKANLRFCSGSENAMNRGKLGSNTSGYKGVVWHKKAGKWRGKIGIRGKSIHLGLFETAIEAAKAYNTAAMKFHGPFAKLNKIPDGR